MNRLGLKRDLFNVEVVPHYSMVSYRFLLTSRRLVKLTASMSERLKRFYVANCAGDDDFEARAKIEQHPDGRDQCHACGFVVGLSKSR